MLALFTPDNKCSLHVDRSYKPKLKSVGPCIVLYLHQTTFFYMSEHILHNIISKNESAFHHVMLLFHIHTKSHMLTTPYNTVHSIRKFQLRDKVLVREFRLASTIKWQPAAITAVCGALI